jgi:hypothetical protein
MYANRESTKGYAEANQDRNRISTAQVESIVNQLSTGGCARSSKLGGPVSLQIIWRIFCTPFGTTFVKS